jgi:hypothetical protein
MKNFSLSILTIFILALFIFQSCKNSGTGAQCNTNSCQSVNADSLANLWCVAWNTKDSVALKGMIAEKALVIDKDWTVEGRDSIFAKWISGSLPSISNVKTKGLRTTSCGCCVSQTGFYKLDSSTKEGVKSQTGNYTFVWMQGEDKTYKLEVIHLTEF